MQKFKGSDFDAFRSNSHSDASKEQVLELLKRMYRLGINYFSLNNLSRAESLFERAVKLAESIDNSLLLAEAKVYLITTRHIKNQTQASDVNTKLYEATHEINTFLDDFGSLNIDVWLENQGKWEEIEQLHQLGNNCRDELQYAKAEKFYQRAAELAEEINDLSLMLKERFWLAAMQGMQGKYQAPLEVFTWLIGVAYDPEQSRKLDEDDLWYVANGFMDFVAVGRYLPEIQAADLERVIDKGLDWLASIGKRNWSAGMRLHRGSLWQAQGRQEAALSEMEAALALHRRQPDAPGYTLDAHLLNLGDCLREMERLEEAEGYYREVAEGHEFSDYEQRWAWEGLAYVALERQAWAEAETFALKSLELARGIEASTAICESYQVLGAVYQKQGQIARATQAGIQTWHYARQHQNEESRYNSYRDIAAIRIEQAKQGNPHRYIPKARRWLQWALPLAVRLDRQVSLTKRQDRIRQMQAECESVLAGELAT